MNVPLTVHRNITHVLITDHQSTTKEHAYNWPSKKITYQTSVPLTGHRNITNVPIAGHRNTTNKRHNATNKSDQNSIEKLSTNVPKPGH